MLWAGEVAWGYRYQGLVGPQVLYPVSYGYLRVQQWVQIGGFHWS